MSQQSRPRTRGLAQRRRRDHFIDPVMPLERRSLLAPVVVTVPPAVTFTAAPAATVSNTNLGTVTIAPAATTVPAAYPTQAPVTSVNQLTPSSSFGGDIVRIQAGPGGVFGNAVYAISRGAGENSGAVDRPGVIYRVDPATGKTSVFFDLNTVVTQETPPASSAANSVSTASGLVNWYDIAFDPEGYFTGQPAMYVATVDRTNPNLNAVYEIGPNAQLIAVFTQFTAGQTQAGVKFNINPSSILVMPPQDQSFLRGLFTGSGSGASTIGTSTFNALFFNANGYSPGTPISSTTLPNGVTETQLSLGPQVGLTDANADYASPVYSAFTDFGTPAGPGIPAVPGFSGVQGYDIGELLIAPPATTTTVTTLTLDQTPAVTTPFRRFEDIAFDEYGYFSQGLPLTTTTTNNVATVGIGSPVYAGSLFVSDLATGLQTAPLTITPRAPLPTTPVTLQFPIQGPGTIGITTDSSGNVIPLVTNGNTTGGTNIGGRILRITPTGQVTVFANNFNTSGAQDSTSFIDSSLSISFSADGTVLYASDDDGIWQFKTTADLANSTSGSLIGLNDLQAFGAPYDGNGAAVAIIDTGVDAASTPFRGRVAPGTNVVTGTDGNIDTAASTAQTATTGTGANSTNNTVLSTGVDGHGTLIAGVVAQFVPQATLQPVNIFNPFQTLTGTTGTTTGANGAGGTGLGFNSNASTSSENVYNGIKYVADHPFVNDPIRPGKVDRVVATTFGFGSQTTFASERTAYNKFPQLVISLKNQLRRFRKLGIAPVAAAGQFGSPLGDTTGTTGGGGGGATGNTTGTIGANNAGNNNVGDSNGMSLPAALNEVVSVTGVVPFPFVDTPATSPIDSPLATTPTGQPLLISAGVTGTTGTTVTTANGSPLTALLLGNTQPAPATGGNTTTTVTSLFFNGIPQGLYADRVLASANRSVTTDFAAPAADIPTFRRTFSLSATTSTTGATTTTSDPNDHLTFTEGGTSLAAGIVAGSFALVSSALNYWTTLNTTGVTSDAYLNVPVGQTTLNFGPHPFKSLSAYNNPDGINAILAWTAVPANDPNDGLSQSQPPYQIGTQNFRNYARVDVGNAIAAIEGTEAIQYLLQHKTFNFIDTNKNGIITTQELQTFVDNASAMGMPEAGAMARLLGGTASTPTASPSFLGENPDQAGALQRRFNFFDYSADGQLNGSVTIAEFKMLAHTLLPLPDAYTVTDRQRASANGFLLDPTAVRNFHDLQHLLPQFEFVPKSALLKYRNISPNQFGIARLRRNFDAPNSTFPVWTLFSDSGVQATTTPAQTTPSADAPNNSGTNQVASSTSSGSSNATPAASTTKTSSSTASPTATSSTGTSTGSTASTASTSSGSQADNGATGSSSNSSSSGTPSSSASTTADQIKSILLNAVNGISGSSGSTASTGSTGSTGTTASTGSSGTTGSNASSGTTGSTGTTASTGTTGTKGNTGTA